MKENMLRGLVITSAFVLAGCNTQLSEIPPNIAVPTDSPVFAASQMMDLHEIEERQELKALLGVDPSRTEWCAAFVNAILNEKGIPGSESVSDVPLMARSFLYWGNSVEEPEVGDVVVFPRGDQGWQGHVGFYVMTSADGKYYYILGGNQNEEVSILRFSAASALDIRRNSTSNPLPL